MPNLQTVTRYHLRKFVYNSSALRKLLVKKKPAVPSGDEGKTYWDNALSSSMATYMGGTLSIDARNALVAVLIKHNATPSPTLLDVGCAGGTLAHDLHAFTHYTGVDISPYAVEQANTSPQFAPLRAQDKINFVASDMTTLPLSPNTFDVIVFNEVLYYLSVEDALTQVARYKAALTKDGLLCVSMKDDPKAHAIYAGLARTYPCKESLLYQSTHTHPPYRVKINRERPAFLLAAFQPNE